MPKNSLARVTHCAKLVRMVAPNEVVLQAVKDRFVEGFERVAPLISSAEAARVDELAIQRVKYASSSLWFCDRIEKILPTLLSLLTTRSDLRRLTVYVLEPDSLAAAIVHPKYRLIFRYPSLKIVLVDPTKPLDSMRCREIFEMSEIDQTEPTDFLFYFREDFPNREEWKKQFIGIHSFVSMAGRRVDDFEFATGDQVIGFENTLANIPTMFRSPDLRKTINMFSKKTAVVVGAGPSIGPQLDWLRSKQDEVLIVAADTMLIPLRKSGIEADVIASIERVPETIELLDREHPHPNTLLVASSVLLPECFKAYQGPNSIYFAQNPYEAWLPFERSSLSTGNSCVGLGIVLAGMFGCDPIVLMGVDLCWAPGGESHTANVPYLDKETYKKNNSLRYEESFSASNFKGEDVRTNHYWVMFQSQFNRWMSYIQGKVYNVSSFGLPLSGAQNIALDDLPELPRLNKTASSQLIKRMPYDRTAQRLSDLEELSKSASDAAVEISRIRKRLTPAQTAEYSSLLEQSIMYPLVLKSLVRYAVQATSKDDKEQAENARKLIDDSLVRVEESFDRCQIESKEFKEKAIQEKWKLY